MARQFAYSASSVAAKSTRRMKDDSAAEAELARQFAASRSKQRYGNEQPQGATPFSPASYDFSPMALVDDGPSEPLFTPLPERRRRAAVPAAGSSNQFQQVSTAGAVVAGTTTNISNLRSQLNLHQMAQRPQFRRTRLYQPQQAHRNYMPPADQPRCRSPG